MQLRDLPDDVLRLVLKASIRTRHNIAATLKTNLPLLAVCRRWRHLALEYVYSDVDICCHSRPNRGSGPGDVHTTNAGDEPDDAEITTNLDLVASAGCVQTVKQVDIVVYCSNNPFPSIGAVIQLMRAAAETWSGVRQLKMRTCPGGYSFDRRRINVADYEKDIEQTSAAFAATMPGVNCLYFGGNPTNDILQGIYGQLATLYSGQLKKLHSHKPIVVPLSHTFRQLRDVSIRYKIGSDYQHPRVDPATLVSLSLVPWPSNHSWAPFSADGDSGAIEFPCLERLSVLYWSTDIIDGVEARHRDGHPWRLRFPKLSVLGVNCNQDTCPLLEYAVLPSRMGDISIEGTAPVLARVAEMRLPATRNLAISIKDSSNGDPAALAAANRILESTPANKECALSVKDRLLPVVPESITCTSLAVLEIYADTSADTMLVLIRMLPGLVNLMVQSLTLGDIQEDVSVPGPDEACLVEPLSSKLREIWIGVSSDEPAPEMLVSVAKYLLLRIPTLDRFCLNGLLKRPISEFVGAYSKQYPHLRGIEYELDKWLPL